jgi:hypothetical protein
MEECRNRASAQECAKAHSFLEKQIQKMAEQGNAGGKFCVYKE